MTEPPQGPAMGADQVGRLGDRYEVGGLLGRGGMADVRVGRDLRLGRTVAIKRLRNDLASDPTFQARFRREAQSAASLNHPSIVAVYDTGEEIGPDGQGVPFIVMELVEGQTLREVLRQDRKILPQRALDITADILNALDYSHRAGIVHRDIKPANVMLTPSGQVKVMDFGIARAIADSSSAMTQTAAVVGTAQYLSPEQARGEQVDARSDIYSTGCLLFELLTGRPPFVGDSPVSVAYQHVREEPPAPSQFNPEVTPAMDAVVLKALTKRTEDRYQSASDMRADIERVLAGLDVAGPTVTTPVAAMPMAPPQQDATSTIPAAVPPPQEPYEEQRKRRKWPWILVIVLVLAIIAGAAYAFRDDLTGGGGGGGTAEKVEIPDLAGQDPDTAINRLENQYNLEVAAKRDYKYSKYDEGLLAGTDPAAGEQVEEGDTVTLIESMGPREVEIPTDLKGQNVNGVVQQIEDLGFKTVSKEIQYDTEAPKNSVVSIKPGGQGAPQSLDTPITVYYSAGYQKVPDPLVGRKINPALTILENQGFDTDNNVDVVDDPDSTEPEGTVTSVDPGEGEYVDPKETITLTVSTGENAEEDDPGNEGNGNEGNEGNDDESESPRGKPTERGLPGDLPFGLLD